MYAPIPNGEKELIYDLYECHIPPVGYGIDSTTGSLEKTDVIMRSTKIKEQKWERTPLPYDWVKKRKIESVLQQNDENYFDPKLEEFRQQEWKRRLRGVWFYNNGKPTYITGEHYMYLNWWHLDDGYPEYREPDRKRYYVLQYCIEDPRCAGMIEAANRRSGKSYRGGLFVYEYTSRTADANSGIQSKTDSDAKNLFKGKVVTPFRRLPDFFRPTIDTSAGANPEKEIKFTPTTKRGKQALSSFDDLGLNSYINFLSSEQFAYDGWKLHRYLGDEVGKTLKVNVYDRHQVIKYCLRVGGKWIGKALYTTTVEKLKKEEESKLNGQEAKAFKMLWDESNPLERDANGHTKSGLYKYFTPAYEMYDFDEYGFPKIEEGKEFYLNTRAGLLHNPRGLASEICKNPFSEKEMFKPDGDKSIFDPIVLGDRLDDLYIMKNVFTKGDFIWENGVQDSKVIFKPNKNGRFDVTYLFEEEGRSNNRSNKGGIWYPNNSSEFVIGADPFSHGKTVDKRRSNGAGLCYMKFNAAGNSPYRESFVAKYNFRTATPSEFYEDMLKMAVYYGCHILWENNKNNWDIYFKQRGYEGFLMKLDDYPDYGIPGNENTHKQITEITIEYIHKNINKVFFPDLIEQWLEFDPADTTKSDLVMAAGYTLIADLRKTYKKTITTLRPMTEYGFRKHKIA